MVAIRYVNDLGNGHSGYIDAVSGIPVTTLSGQALKITTAGTPAGDAFGRARTAQPLTLFDSSHRYSDNGLWATATGVSSDATFNANAGLVNLNVPTTSGAYVKRETKSILLSTREITFGSFYFCNGTC